MKPQVEGFYWYKKIGFESTIVYVEYRCDSGELYAFSIGFEGGIRIQTMDGEWSEPLQHEVKQ